MSLSNELEFGIDQNERKKDMLQWENYQNNLNITKQNDIGRIEKFKSNNLVRKYFNKKKNSRISFQSMSQSHDFKIRKKLGDDPEII